jgi:hypothetical protein
MVLHLLTFFLVPHVNLKNEFARCQWLLPVILAAQEAEIRRIKVQSQAGQIVHETLCQKKPFTKKGWWNGSRCGPEFKSQYPPRVGKMP